jgi:hypothetical protein
MEMGRLSSTTVRSYRRITAPVAQSLTEWVRHDREDVSLGTDRRDTKEDTMNPRIAFGRTFALVVLAGCLTSATAIASNPAHGPRVPRSPANGGKVTVRITATSRTPGEVTNGGVAGKGRFAAVGAIRDKGTEVTYRTMHGALITLRFVTVGHKGTITFVVKIDTSVGTSRWTIASGTKAYRGLHGKGTERENATYTVSTLTGTVWR